MLAVIANDAEYAGWQLFNNFQSSFNHFPTGNLLLTICTSLLRIYYFKVWASQQFNLLNLHNARVKSMSSFSSCPKASSKGPTVTTITSKGAWSCPGASESLFWSCSLICQAVMSSTSSSYSSSGETSPEDLHRGGGTIRVYLPNKQRTVVR